MYSCIKDIVELMNKNYIDCRMKLPYDGEYINHYGALIGAVNGTSVDNKKVKDIRIKISKKTPWHSELRGDGLYIVSYILAMDPDINVERYIDIYNKLISSGIKESYTVPFISYIVLRAVKEDNIQPFIDRINELYDAMKEMAYDITFVEDYLYCALLALKNIKSKDYCKIYKGIYEKLKPLNYISNNELQSLTNLIIFFDEELIEEKILRVTSKLEDIGIKVRSENIIQLGIACKFLKEKQIIEGIEDISEALNEFTEYDLFMDKSFRLLMNTTILNMYYNREKEGLILILFSLSVMQYLQSRKQSVMMFVNS